MDPDHEGTISSTDGLGYSRYQRLQGRPFPSEAQSMNVDASHADLEQLPLNLVLSSQSRDPVDRMHNYFRSPPAMISPLPEDERIPYNAANVTPRLPPLYTAGMMPTWTPNSFTPEHCYTCTYYSHIFHTHPSPIMSSFETSEHSYPLCYGNPICLCFPAQGSPILQRELTIPTYRQSQSTSSNSFQDRISQPHAASGFRRPETPHPYARRSHSQDEDRSDRDARDGRISRRDYADDNQIAQKRQRILGEGGSAHGEPQPVAEGHRVNAGRRQRRALTIELPGQIANEENHHDAHGPRPQVQRAQCRERDLGEGGSSHEGSVPVDEDIRVNGGRPLFRQRRTQTHVLPGKIDNEENQPPDSQGPHPQVHRAQESQRALGEGGPAHSGAARVYEDLRSNAGRCILRRRRVQTRVVPGQIDNEENQSPDSQGPNPHVHRAQESQRALGEGGPDHSGAARVYEDLRANAGRCILRRRRAQTRVLQNQIANQENHPPFILPQVYHPHEHSLANVRFSDQVPMPGANLTNNASLWTLSARPVQSINFVEMFTPPPSPRIPSGDAEVRFLFTNIQEPFNFSLVLDGTVFEQMAVTHNYTVSTDGILSYIGSEYRFEMPENRRT